MCGCGDHSKGHYQGSCCCGDGRLKRRFFTREEKAAKLEEYIEDLQAEIKAVESKIKRIKEKE